MLSFVFVLMSIVFVSLLTSSCSFSSLSVGVMQNLGDEAAAVVSAVAAWCTSPRDWKALSQ